MNKLIMALYSFFSVAVTGLICSYFTVAGTSTFFSGLNQPAIMPPGYVFSIAWSILYVLMIVSFYRILISRENIRIQDAVSLFLGQLVLQILWCYLFFYQGYFLFALIEIVLLFITVWFMIKQFKIIDNTAAYLQYPYLFWLIFATVLNGAVFYLNGAQL